MRLHSGVRRPRDKIPFRVSEARTARLAATMPARQAPARWCLPRTPVRNAIPHTIRRGERSFKAFGPPLLCGGAHGRRCRGNAEFRQRMAHRRRGLLTSRMISSFSAAGSLVRRSPQPRSRFFSAAVLEHEFGDHLFRHAGLAAQDPSDLVPRSLPVPCHGQALLASLRNPSTSGDEGSGQCPRGAQLGDAVLAAQPRRHRSDLFLRETAAGWRGGSLSQPAAPVPSPARISVPVLRSFNGYDRPRSSLSQLRGADEKNLVGCVRHCCLRSYQRIGDTLVIGQ